MEAEEYRELDEARVIVLGRFGERGKIGGLELGRMQTKGAGLLHVRGDKVTRLVLYWDRERALADLGLSPQADAAESPECERRRYQRGTAARGT